MQNQFGKDILEKLTIKDKIKLLSGKNAWQSADLPKFKIPSFNMSDGPHGIRKVKAKGALDGSTLPSTCFPSEALMACSFDKDLLFKEGQQIAKEAKKYDVDVILGPGLNIKRSPICGRNFEYYSEDPVLSGLLGGSFIKGAKSENVSTCVKHFAANNEESHRHVKNCIIDSKALREIYLKSFDVAIRYGNPDFVMASYNKINGVHLTENRALIHDFLRNTLEYKGLVISDWGAVSNKIESINAGLDIEMPFINWDNAKVLKAFKKKHISEESVNESVERIINYALSRPEKEQISDSIFDENYDFAVKAASESIVLAKNNRNILPLKPTDKVAFIGPFVRNERFQGEGSSKLIAYKYKTLEELIQKYSSSAVFCDGCSASSSGISQTLLQEATKAAQSCNKVVLFLGTKGIDEGEGFDRDSLSLPNNQLNLVEQILKVNRNVVVNIFSGSVVELPFLDKIKGLTISYLGGEGINEALLNVLYGKVNPSGKLAETWIKSLDDNPTYDKLNTNKKYVEYRDSIYVGYRFYEYANTEVNFPFGHGFSYSEFEYSNLSVSKITGSTSYLLKLKIKNIGKTAGKEVIQVYTKYLSDTLYVSPIDLSNFTKVYLEPGEEKDVEIKLNEKAFEQFSILKDRYMSHTGKYEILVGSSIKDIRLKTTINVKGNGTVSEKKPASYANIAKTGRLKITSEDFAKLLKIENLKDLKKTDEDQGFNYDSTLEDIADTKIGKKILKAINAQIEKTKKADGLTGIIFEKSYMELPIRTIMMGGKSERMVKFILKSANRHSIFGKKEK